MFPMTTTLLDPTISAISLTAWGYYRISLVKDDGDAAKPARQEEIMKGRCEPLNIDHARSFFDHDISAWDENAFRPGYEDLITQIENGPERPNFICCYHWDRISRNMKDAGRLIAVCKRYKIRIISPQGIVDPDNPNDEMMLWFSTLFAKRASDDTSRRVRDANAYRASHGLPFMGGFRPFGMNEDRFTPHPEEAPVVRQVAQWVLEGVPRREIARRLNASGSQTTRGNDWTKEALKKMLLRPGLAGFVSSRKYPERAEGRLKNPDGSFVTDVVLDEETWRAVCAILNAGRQVTQNVESGRYLLARMVYCGNPVHGERGFGPKMRGKRDRRVRVRDYSFYACDGKDDSCGIGIAAKPTEEFVEALVLEALSDPNFAVQLNSALTSKSAEWQRLDAKRRQLRDALDRHAANVDAMVADNRTYMIQQDALMKALHTVEEQMGVAKVDPKRAERLKALSERVVQERWNAASYAEKRSMIQQVILGIQVMPAIKKGGGVWDQGRIRLIPLV